VFWLEPVDIYCERLGPGFWAEPVNALTNLAFPLAALWAWQTARTHGGPRPAEAAPIALVALIGVGSFLFHTFANRWSALADVAAILAFFVVYTLCAIALTSGVPLARLVRIGAIIVAVITAILLAISSAQSATDTAPLNGSGQYAPALLALVVFSAIMLWRRHPIRYWALGATLVFLVSLTFRTVDLAVCPTLPLGTHFMWHLLNGLMLGLLLQGLIRSGVAVRKGR